MKNLHIDIGVEKSTDGLHGSHFKLTFIQVDGNILYQSKEGLPILGSDISGVSLNFGLSEELKTAISTRNSGGSSSSQGGGDGGIRPGNGEDKMPENQEPKIPS